MEFVETSVFSRRLAALLTDDEYRVLQSALLVEPDVGDIVPQSGGLRKMRWGIPGRGKRGGLRVIYYWRRPHIILMLFVYAKSEQEDLTPDQLRTLVSVAKETYR